MRRLTRATLYANATTANAMNVHGRTYRGGRSERARRVRSSMSCRSHRAVRGDEDAHVAFAVAIAFVSRRYRGRRVSLDDRDRRSAGLRSVARWRARFAAAFASARSRARRASRASGDSPDGGGFGIDDGGAFFERPGEHGGAEGIVGDERLGGVQWESRGGAQATAAREPRLDGASFEGLARGRMVTGSRMSSRLTGQKKSAGAFARARRILDVEGGVVGVAIAPHGVGGPRGVGRGDRGVPWGERGRDGAIIVPEETRHVVAFFSGDGRPEAARARTRARQRRAGRATFAVTRTARGRARRTRQAGSRARLWRRGATVEDPMPSAVTDDARG